MLDYTEFNAVFGSLSPFPFDKSWAQRVESHRRNLDGALFIDRVLGALNLGQALKSYPPKNESALRQLHQQVCDAGGVAVHHKLSILYYLLLDVDARQQQQHQSAAGATTTITAITGGHSRAEDFAAGAAVPRKYSIFMKGLWLLDAAAFDLALEYLTHPSLVPDFADDVVVALARHAPDGDHLALAYYHTVQPVLRTSLALELLFDALARSSVPEALAFARARPAFVHRQLFRRLVLAVLGDNPAAARRGGEEEGRQQESPATARALELASLSLDTDEERWFAETLASPDAKGLRGAKDTLLMRRITRGEVGSVSEKGDWAVVLDSFRAGSGGRA